LVILKIILWIFCIVTALVLLVLLGVILALNVKVGINFDYDSSGTALKIKYGFLGIKILPKKEKKPKKENKPVGMFKFWTEGLINKLKGKAVESVKTTMEKKGIEKELKEAEELASEQVRIQETETRLNAEMKEAEELERKTRIADAIGNPYPDVVDESKVEELGGIKGKLATMDLEAAFDDICSYVEAFDKDSVTALLSFIGQQTGTTFKKVGKRISVKEFGVTMTVSGDDAAKTAIKYGRIAAVAYPALNVMKKAFNVKNMSLELVPDFLANSDAAEFHNHVAFRPLRVIAPFGGYALKVGKRSLKVVGDTTKVADKLKAERKQIRQEKLINQTADQLALSNTQN